jgi:hypothetical protein
MKFILHILAGFAVLPVSGCAFPPNRDYSDDYPRASLTLNRKTPGDKTKTSGRGKLSGPAWRKTFASLARSSPNLESLSACDRVVRWDPGAERGRALVWRTQQHW